MASKNCRWPPLCDTIEVSKNCFDAMMYVSARSRWSVDLQSRLLRADKINQFDWSSVYRGEEDFELKKYGIFPKHQGYDLVNPWDSARPKTAALLTSLFKDGLLTYAIQDKLLQVDRQIKSLLDYRDPVTIDIVEVFLGDELKKYANQLL